MSEGRGMPGFREVGVGSQGSAGGGGEVPKQEAQLVKTVLSTGDTCGGCFFHSALAPQCPQGFLPAFVKPFAGPDSRTVWTPRQNSTE